MLEVPINYWAVLVSAVVAMVVGGLWFGPLFGKTWARLSGRSMENIDKDAAKKGYFWAFIGALVAAYVLAHFVGLIGLTTWGEALQLGFWTWLGFFATTQLGMVLWDGKPFKLYVLTTLQNLVVLLITSVILTLWV